MKTTTLLMISLLFIFSTKAESFPKSLKGIDGGDQIGVPVRDLDDRQYEYVTNGSYLFSQCSVTSDYSSKGFTKVEFDDLLFSNSLESKYKCPEALIRNIEDFGPMEYKLLNQNKVCIYVNENLGKQSNISCYRTN